MLKKILCSLFQHKQIIYSKEEGKGKEFRYVYSCHCGKKVNKSDWTDDNQLLGYGKY